MEIPPKDKDSDESAAKKQKVEEVSGNEGISLMPYIRFNSICREAMALMSEPSSEASTRPW